MHSKLMSCLLASAAALAVPAMANAQAVGLEEVVVTAQRRSENLQQVPIAVATVTANDIQRAGVNSTDTLRQVTPGVMFTTQQRSAQVFIRGVGSQGTGAGDEAAVPIYIDGVYYPSAWGNMFSFNNIDRVEVLKGPQGTLFGRNATGGLVHIITRDPTSEFGVEGSANYGNFDTKEGSLYVTGGGEKIATDFAGYYVHQGKGWGKDLINGGDVNRKREWSLRSKTVWRPTDDDKLTFAIDYSWNTSDIGLIRTPLPGVPAIGGFLNPGTIYDGTGNIRNPEATKIENKGGSVKYERALGDVNLSILTAARRETSRYKFDSDGTPTPSTRSQLQERSRTLQNEILLNGSTGKVDWTVGTFLFNADTFFWLSQVPTTVATLNWVGSRKLNTKSVAGFADASYHLTEQLKLTAGLRYTTDTRDFSVDDRPLPGYPATAPALPQFQTDAKWSRWTWRGVLDYKLNDDVLLYASYNRGFKSGVYSMSTPLNPVVNPETIDAFELGAKTELFDRTLRFNVAAYHYKYKDIQLQQPIVGGSIIFNAAEAKINGIDFDAQWAPRISTGNLMVRAGLTVLDAKYKSFPTAPISVPNPGSCDVDPTRPGNQPGQLPGPRTGGNLSCSGDVSGNRMVRTPKVMSNISIDYSIDVGAGEMGVSGNWYHNSGFFWEPDNRTRQPAFDLFNGQVYYAFGPEKAYRVRLWGKNLTDEKTFTQVSQIAFGDQGVPNAPRTYGVGFDFKY